MSPTSHSPVPEETYDEHIKFQLSYNQMICLIYYYLKWAMEDGRTPEQIVKLVRCAKQIHRVMDTVGEEWEPPEPENISFIGYLGRKAEKWCENELSAKQKA